MVIKFLSEKYKLPLYITENGMACHDSISADGKVHDPNRITFLDSYISAMQQASDDGADVRGYFLWSILDNFEWANGFDERFGIVYVDYRNQKRIIKDSAFWYKNVIESNGKCLSINDKSNEIIVEDVSETNDYMSLSENETIKFNTIYINDNIDCIKEGLTFIVYEGNAILNSSVLYKGAKVSVPKGLTDICLLGECDIKII
ncbi:family 1 glycosylhydrolase [Lachnobacterium bovis]|uniref:family 1 glycosylhydrolase n=1 Tax=Lachnobacterium bovis TaxID=140626 RepID=UPI00048B131B|nr:family 1 glycosylhydrolase [Lachnobacterium bovis]